MGMEAENWERRNQKCLRNCPAFWELELGWKSGTWTVFSPLIVFFLNHVLSAHAEYLVKFSNHVETVSSFYLCFSVPRLIVC